MAASPDPRELDKEYSNLVRRSRIGQLEFEVYDIEMDAGARERMKADPGAIFRGVIEATGIQINAIIID